MEMTRLKMYEGILNVLNSNTSNIVPPLISNEVKEYAFEWGQFFGGNAPSKEKLMALDVVDAGYFFNCLGNYWFLHNDGLYITLKSDGTYDLMDFDKKCSEFKNAYDSGFKYLETLYKEVLDPKYTRDRAEFVKRSEENFKLFKKLFENKYVIFGRERAFDAYSNLQITKSDGRFHIFEANELEIVKFSDGDLFVAAWDEKRLHKMFVSSFKPFNDKNCKGLYFEDGTFRKRLYNVFKCGNDINEMFDFMKEKYHKLYGNPSKSRMETFEEMRKYFLM